MSEGVFVVLDHRHEPDQLRDRVFYSTWEQAETQAAKMRTCTRCPPAAIEVVELQWAVAQ